MRLISHFLGPYRRDFLLAVLCVAAETSLELFIPILMAQVIDQGIMAADLSVVLANGALMLACAAAALALGLAYARFSARAAMGLGARLREAEYTHLQTFSFADIDDFEGSSLVTRLTTDVTVVQNALVTGTRPPFSCHRSSPWCSAWSCRCSPWPCLPWSRAWRRAIACCSARWTG